MIHHNDKEAARIRRTLALYNALPNIFWSVLCLLPLTVFCYTLLPFPWFLVFLALSGVPVFLPNALFDKMQVGKTASVYKKLGVEVVSRLAQNGGLINRRIRKKFPAYRAVTVNRASIHKRIQHTYIREVPFPAVRVLLPVYGICLSACLLWLGGGSGYHQPGV